MDMQEQEYNEPPQNLDMSLDQGNTELGILEQIAHDDVEGLISGYKGVLGDREKLDGVKKEISKLNSNETKEYFLTMLWNKLTPFVEFIIGGKQKFTRLRQSNILELFMLTQIRSAITLSESIYTLLHKVIEKQNEFDNFAYLVRFLFKIAKHIDKREQMLAEILGLYKNIKQGQSNPIFVIADRCKNKAMEQKQTLNSNEEQKIRLALLLLNYLAYGDSPHSRYADEQFKKTAEVIKHSPYTKVAEYLIDSGRNKKFLKDIVNCDFKVEDGAAKFVFNLAYLHPELQTQENYLKALIALPEKIFGELRKQNFVLANDKIYSKINVQTLKKISQLSKVETGEYTNQSLEQLVTLIKFFLQNLDKKIASQPTHTSVMQQQSKQETSDKYLVYIWAIFVKYYYEHQRNQMDFGYLFQQINVEFLNKLLNKCLDFLGKGEEYGEFFAEEVVKVVIHLLYKVQYAAQANYANETSKILQTLLLKMKCLPIKWKGLKKVKALLDKWGESITEVTPNLSILINKFLDSFFNPALKLKSRNFSQFEMLTNPHYTKTMGITISAKIRELLQKSITRLDALSLKQQRLKQEQFTKLNGILYKMICLYMSRIKIPDNEIIADLLFKLYQNWAYGINFIYCFRTWILNYSNKSKDEKAMGIVRHISEQLLSESQKFRTATEKLTVQDVFKPLLIEKDNENSVIIVEAVFNLRLLVNNMHLKQRQDIYGSQLYLFIIQVLQSLTKTLGALHSRILSQLSTNFEALSPKIFQTYLSSHKTVYDQLQQVYTDLTYIVRFYLCNLNKLIDNKDQLHFLQQLSTLIRSLSNKENIQTNNLKLINNVFGFNVISEDNVLTKWQLFGTQMARNGLEGREQYNFNKEDYTPVILISVLYARIRADYVAIVKNLLATTGIDQDKEKQKPRQSYADIYQQAKHYSSVQNTKQLQQQQKHYKLQKESQIILTSIVLPSINVFGPSYYANKLEEKGKEQEAYGILCDQFNMLFNEKLTSKEILGLHSQLLYFFEIGKDKGKKVINKQLTQMQRNHRRGLGLGQAHRAALLTELGLMGFQPEAVEFALESVDDHDPENIINWLEANQHRLNELMTNRVIQRSRAQSIHSKKVQTQKSAEIPLVGYNQLIRNIETGTKLIIKSLKNQLFSQIGNKIKDLIFICLDSFQNQDYRNKQLNQFSQLMFKELDKLNTNFEITKLQVIVSTIETILLRKTDLIAILHQRLIVNTLLGFLQRANQATGQKILSIINLSLPNPNEKSSKEMKQYLCYIGDVLLGSNIVSGKQMEILCKMVKCKDAEISEKVLKIVCKGLSKGIIREKLFSILGLVLDSDKQFSSANIELELKSFIIENHDYKKKQRFLKLDPKKFGLAFSRYEDHPFFLQVVNKILTKRNGKLTLQLQKHNLFSSEILNFNYLAYTLQGSHKILIQNLVHQIVKQQNPKHRVQYIRELYKTLQFYKLLIPFCMRLPVEGGTFVEWLIEKEFARSRGQIVGFITFLFVRNGLYLSQEESFSDYLTAQLIFRFMKYEQVRKSHWVKVLIIYLLQIKNFNIKAHYFANPQNQINLKQVFQKQLDIIEPINYVLTSQALYLVLKKQLIDSLMTKYKIENEQQSGLEKQFLNMDLFYNKRRSNRVIDDQEGDQLRPNNGRMNLQRLLAELSGENRDDNEDMEALHVLRRMLLHRDRSSEFVVQSSANLNNIFVPIQPPAQQQLVQQPQQGQQAQQQAVQEQQRKISQEMIEKKEQLQSKMEQEKVEQKHYLCHILQNFTKVLPETTQAKSQSQWKFVNAPKTGLKAIDLKDASYNSTLKQPRVTLDQRFAKTNIFKQRIVQIAQIVDPNEKMVISEEKKITNAEQRDRERQAYSNGLRRMMINRLMSGERERERQVPIQPINVNRLLNNMPEYVEPKVEEKPKEKQEKPVEKVQQKKIQQQKKQEPKPNQMVEQRPVEQKPKQPEQKVQNIEQPRPEQQQQTIPLIPQQNRMEEQPRDVPVEQPQQQQMVQEPVQPHRQILSMLGLPQTFLRDLGIDTFSFDSLPQDMQIEQLTLLMEQQHVANRQQQNQQRNDPNQPNQQNQPNPPQVHDLASQNAAFIASLDPQLRAQTLMEATPEFLMTLPPALRAEAENYRQRQISQMLRDQEMEMQQQRINRARAPKTLIYPQLTAQNFPSIDQETAVRISQSILLRLPKFNLQIFKILLQNKKTQKQAITTLISYIKNVEQLTILECTYNKDKKQWQKQKISLTGSNRKTFIQEILVLIENHLTNCIYKDTTFLSGKHEYAHYAESNLPLNPELMGDEQGYYPVYELIDIAIDNHSYGLLNKLVKKVSELPKRLRKRIVRGIRDDKFNQDFYANLEGLSNDQKFKETFQKEFPEDKPIKIETLSKVLKYNFSKLPYLKKLHVETLKKCKGTPPKQIYDFLNQIYSSYSVQDIKQIEPLLLEHKQIHYYIIKYLYESGKTLDTEPIGLILKFPHLLDFDTKRFIFQKNPKLHRSRHRCVIEVNRLNLFQESFNQIMGKSLKELEGSIKVVFMDEQAEDAGGPKKQWFLSLSKQIFDPQYALFQPSSSGNTYQPNPKSYVNTQHLSYFKFIGRFFAKALCQGMLIDAFFTRSFYKMILGHELELKDLQEQDYSFYKSMIWLKQNQMKGDEEYTFSYIYDYFGKIITKELVPDGQNVKVTEQNKLDYIHKYTMAMMRDSIGAQIGKFLQGFYQVLPKDSISFFEPAELQLLMSGMPSIDLKDLKLNTDYQGYSPNDPVIKWYWQILEEYTNEDLAKLVQFITGTSKIPLQGFSKLQGMHGPQKISIHKDCHIDQLPKSHTCFNQLDLPNYPTKEMLKEKLRVIITWGTEGFGFM